MYLYYIVFTDFTDIASILMGMNFISKYKGGPTECFTYIRKTGPNYIGDIDPLVRVRSSIRRPPLGL